MGREPAIEINWFIGRPHVADAILFIHLHNMQLNNSREKNKVLYTVEARNMVIVSKIGWLLL